MSLARRKFLHLAGGAAATASFSHAAFALDYPTRPITIVVPFAAGGATDVLARVLADAMGKSLGQTMIVENVTGAAGTIGVSRVARAAADGYTLSIGTLTSHVLIGGLYKLDFDLLTDLTPIAELAYEPLLICVKNGLPVHNLQELIAWLKANPGKASVGVPGAGSTGNLADISFQNITGTTFQFVPYRGDAPAVQDMMAGQIDMMIEPSSNFTAQVQAGTIRRELQDPGAFAAFQKSEAEKWWPIIKAANLKVSLD
jgi:tripartite-type tricarboxylate transporter receptor subunit TctC